MKISVCMGIYNGEKYIEEQLLSILHQTRQADEVILCDDNSKDKTPEIVQAFIAKNNLQERWKFFHNEENKGYPGNFYYAMSLCTGDIVFLADQDDIWAETKLERMCVVLEQHPEAKAVCCKFALIDADGGNIRTILSPTHSNGTGKLREVNIGDVFYKCEWPGMVVAYRNAWYQQLGNNAPHSIPHDFLICAKAAEKDGFLQMDEELAYHRRHDSNAGGEEHRLSVLLDKKRKVREIEAYLKILEAFVERQIMTTENGRKALEDKLLSMKGRYLALQSGKISKVLANAWKNRKQVRLATVVCDVVIVRKKT